MEKMSNFQFIWKEWIEPLVDDLFKQLEPSFKNECKVQIRDLDTICAKAEKYYQNKRKEAKKEFYGKYQKGDSETVHRMDSHKIGAILCRTLIEYKVFDMDARLCEEHIKKNIDKYDTNWVVSNALINFRLAFYVSILYLYQAMLFEYSEINADFCKELRSMQYLDLYENQILKYPKKNQNEESEKRVQESFENCVVLDLAKRDIGNRSFDYFLYSTILYQLEQHNINLLILKSERRKKEK